MPLQREPREGGLRLSGQVWARGDRKSTRLNSSHSQISYAVFCLIKNKKSYCSRRFGGATCDDKSAQIYARFDKNDWRIQPAEFYRFHDAEVNTFGYF